MSDVSDVSDVGYVVVPFIRHTLAKGSNTTVAIRAPELRREI
jgi:hypothetical protein